MRDKYENIEHESEGAVAAGAYLEADVRAPLGADDARHAVAAAQLNDTQAAQPAWRQRLRLPQEVPRQVDGALPQLKAACGGGVRGVLGPAGGALACMARRLCPSQDEPAPS